MYTKKRSLQNMNIELKTRKKENYILYNMTRDYANQRQKYEIINLLYYLRRIFKNLN